MYDKKLLKKSQEPLFVPNKTLSFIKPQLYHTLVKNHSHARTFVLSKKKVFQKSIK